MSAIIPAQPGWTAVTFWLDQGDGFGDAIFKEQIIAWELNPGHEFQGVVPITFSGRHVAGAEDRMRLPCRGAQRAGSP
jgi:hypothetical protein